VPSSERSSSSGAAPLPKAVKPLLETKLEEIKTILSALVPEKKKRNVLEEAMFEDDGMGGFESEVMMQGNSEKVDDLRYSIRICPNISSTFINTRRCWYGTTIPRSRNPTSS
jgi:hypothetical protein